MHRVHPKGRTPPSPFLFALPASDFGRTQPRWLMFLFLWITLAIWISGSSLRFPDHPSLCSNQKRTLKKAVSTFRRRKGVGISWQVEIAWHISDFCQYCLTLLYYWASLVAQMVKSLPAVLETWVWSLGWEDPLKKEMATHSIILAWKIPWTEESGYSPQVCKESVLCLLLKFNLWEPCIYILCPQEPFKVKE